MFVSLCVTARKTSTRSVLIENNTLKLIVYPVVALCCIYINIWFIDFIEKKFGIVYFDI